MSAEDEIEGFEDEKESEVPSQWLTTLADLSLLLMAFFVLLFSMSSLDTKKFTDSFQSVKKAMGAKGKELMTSPVSVQDVTVMVEQAKLKQQIINEQRKVYNDFRSYVSSKGVEGVVAATLEAGKITLNMPSGVLFEKDAAELSSKGKALLDSMFDFLIKIPGERVNIRGFTDDQPPSPGSRFRDNWELSAMRAVNVLRYMVAKGMPANRLTATGLADLEPLYPNNTEENRAGNRRVEFVLERWIGE
ncbi:flagellar motor rotation protein motb [hydrocarbon metagenome]|uniref:Flagellar motor rotation protein motb n=1 Tax=hydrocarbon metagenome TaxID=938273 RepID=A0A0W8G843_9ZZZZ